MKKLKHSELFPGNFFGVMKDGSFELLLIEDATKRPDDWFTPGMPKVEVFGMAWDCTIAPEGFDHFIEVEFLTDPFPRIVPLEENE